MTGVDENDLDPLEIDPREIDPRDVDLGSDDPATDDDVLLLDEAPDQDLVLNVWEPTGEARVDSALDLLAGLDPDDVGQHAQVFDEIHQQLRGTLTDLDAASS